MIVEGTDMSKDRSVVGGFPARLIRSASCSYRVQTLLPNRYYSAFLCRLST